MKIFTFICACLVLSSVESIDKTGDEPLEAILAKLLDKINKYQVLKPVEFKPTVPLPTWAQHLGLYQSDIRVNFAGNPFLKELRSGPVTAVFDNDMFSTGWIMTALLEADLYGKGAPSYDVNRLQLALETIGAYNNKNEKNSNQSILRTFWPQSFDKTTNEWFQEPINIRNVVLTGQNALNKIPFETIEKVLRSIGLERLVPYVDIIKNTDLGIFLDAFSIPPDFDDTYLNLGLGATLKKMSNKYPVAYKSWLANNTDCKRLIEVTSKYAYRPFDSVMNKNTIDPRTFFYSRHFIQNAKENRQDLSLITTWIQNIDEQRELQPKKVSMPFNLNNVDVTVSANAIYGMTSASIENINDFGTLFLQSDDLQQIYLNTTKFITWAINSNFSGRPDLAQVYYPSRYNFLWYTSRTLFLLENEFQEFNKLDSKKDTKHQNNFASLKEIFAIAKSYLKETFENSVTEFLFQKQIKSESNNEVYFCDFLGQGDKNILGKPEASNDDCLFTTAQSINILIATWTVFNKDEGKLVWKINAPRQVFELMISSVNWLKKNALGHKFKPMNAFFSGSVKGSSSLPFYYPTNVAQYLNGTSVDPKNLPGKDLEIILNGVQGSIDESTYQKLIKEKHLNKPTPLNFDGYNKDIFPFWSSEPYTHAVTLLALSQYNNLIG